MDETGRRLSEDYLIYANFVGGEHTGCTGQWLEDWVRSGPYERCEPISRIHALPALEEKRLSDLTEVAVQGRYGMRRKAGGGPRTGHFVHLTLRRTPKPALRWRLAARTIMLVWHLEPPPR